MRKLYLICSFLSVTLLMRAQTFYEVNYVDDDEEYLGLMIYYGDDNCKMRLVTESSVEEDEVYESSYINMIADKEDEDDVGMMVYLPEEKHFPAFIWYWNEEDASDISEKPYVAYNLKKTDDYFEAESFEEISLKDMTADYVAQFYGEDEPEYQMIVKAIALLKQQDQESSASLTEVTVDDPIVVSVDDEPDAAEGENVAPGQGGSTLDDAPSQNISATPATLHLLLVANTTVSDIGAACKKDMENLNSEFAGIARTLGLKYDYQAVNGNNYNKSHLASLVKNLQPSKNDVVIFFYSGHGFRFDDQQDYYPNMDLCPTSYDDPKENYVALSDVYRELVSKGARLNLVLSDCCNSKIGETMPVVNTNTLFSRSNNNFDRNKLKELFIQASGSLLATAASPGEMSWCGVNGGFFTLSLLESLRSQISTLSSGTPNWETLLANTIASATKRSSNNVNCKVQHGMKMVRIK